MRDAVILSVDSLTCASWGWTICLYTSASGRCLPELSFIASAASFHVIVYLMTATDVTYRYCDEWFVMVLRAPAAVGKSKISSPFFSVWMIFCARIAARLHMSYRGHFMGHVCLTMFTPVVLIWVRYIYLCNTLIFMH